MPRSTHGGGRSRVVPTVVGDPSFYASSCRAVFPLEGENGLRGVTRRSSGGRPYNRPRRGRWGGLAWRRWRPWSRWLPRGWRDRWHSRARSAARRARSYLLPRSVKIRKEASRSPPPNRPRSAIRVRCFAASLAVVSSPLLNNATRFAQTI